MRGPSSPNVGSSAPLEPARGTESGEAAALRDPSATAHRSNWAYLAALAIGVLITCAYLALILPNAYLYRENDATVYLEAARNLAAGRGLIISSRLDQLLPVTQPLSLWPPGLPWLLAAGAKVFGVDPTLLSPCIAWASWASLPLALLFALRPVLSDRACLVVGALASIAPGAIDYAWQPLTDGPFLLFSVISLGLLFRCLGQRSSPVLLFLSGCVAGLGYAFRNVAVGLFLAAAVTFVALAALQTLRPKAAALRVAVWGSGAAVAIAPVLLRNLTVFGVLQPYSLPPSHLGLAANVRYFVAGVFNDAVAVHGLSDFIVWRAPWLAAAVLACCFVLFLARRGLWLAWQGASTGRKAVFIGLLAYFACGGAVVIEARTRYEMGDLIGVRYIWQYDWPLLGAAAILAASFLAARPRRWPIAAALVVIVAGLRLSYAYQEIRMDRQEHALSVSRPNISDLGQLKSDAQFNFAVQSTAVQDRQLLQAVRDLPANTILWSDNPETLSRGNGPRGP